MHMVIYWPGLIEAHNQQTSWRLMFPCLLIMIIPGQTYIIQQPVFSIIIKERIRLHLVLKEEWCLGTIISATSLVAAEHLLVALESWAAGSSSSLTYKDIIVLKKPGRWPVMWALQRAINSATKRIQSVGSISFQKRRRRNVGSIVLLIQV